MRTRGIWGWGRERRISRGDAVFFSREAAKNAKEMALYGYSAPSLEEVFSATEFKSLRVLCVLCVLCGFA
jgi:hypothetical protein